MASTTITPVATLIASVISGLSGTFAGGSVALKAYTYDPGMEGLDQLPAGIVGLPSIERVRPEEPESQMGSRDWHMSFPVALMFDLAVASEAQVAVADVVEAFIKAIDTDTLQASDATIVDAKVVSCEPSVVMTDARPVLAYDCTLDVLKLV